MSAEQKCRKCGCTQTRACVTDAGPCYWVEPDLCSACCESELRLSQEDLLALELAPPIGIELGGAQAMILLSALQLAMRHPQFGEMEPTREFVTSFTVSLAQYVGLTPNLRALCAAGSRKNDEPTKYSRLILPPDS